MANTRFGNFSKLSQGKEPMTAEEAWIMLNQLGLIGQEFVPGATSVRKLMEGKPKEAVEELQDWIPGNAAYQNFIRGKEQDWLRNALDAMIIAKPFARGVKKVAETIEKMPKGGKEGFVQLSTSYKNTTPKTIIQDAGLTGRDKKDFEECIKQMNIAINAPTQSARNTAYQRAIALRDRMSPKSKDALSAYTTANSARKMEANSRRTGQKFYSEPKPEGFDNWPADERIRYIKEETNPTWSSQVLDPENIDAGLRAAKITKDQGPLFTDIIMDADYRKALLDKEAEEILATERAAAETPITMTEVQDLSTGVLPSETGVSRGGVRPSYNHRRQFMDTELKQVPGIDRTGMSYGSNNDAFYDLYKAWRDNPGEEEKALRKVIREAKSKDNVNTTLHTDPYYAAGVVGDKNNRLWERINKLREEGKSDSEIRSLLKDDLDKYQGYLERFKSRMPSKNKAAQFEYDGATTNVFKALPSEEARALKALGVDTPEYDELERLGNFYRVFFPE